MSVLLFTACCIVGYGISRPVVSAARVLTNFDI